MRSIIITLISTLLFSSVPTHSSTILSRDSGVDSDSVQGLREVRISIVINGQRVDSYDDNSCPKKENNCFHEGNRRTNLDFRCGKKFFSKIKILRAAAAACPRIENNSQKHVYPAAYAASDYEIKGPYWEWPIRRNGRIWNRFSRSKYRIILTKDCTVVGAVIRNKRDHSYKQCEPILD
ncbi:putative secreted effector protein [Golovinomyces cichoracearum]|uniref:Putative secreted effector protein n=1 Tax=Golovinomyces cichoracearum TaxID=62708 RepID=A0A420GZ62_9PEZI|nr:putative secreted effector protein [Golovinomyces cichoracearum]